MAEAPDPKKVFIIHGRNAAAKTALEHFVRTLGLEPIDFDQLSADVGGSAFIGDIVRAGLERAQGIIALFTPDEHATLRPEYRGECDSAEDTERHQARPNVSFEAGMAYGMAPERTVLVTVGTDVSLFSDVAGIHVIRLNNHVSTRSRLRQKLIGLKLAVREREDAWTDPSRSGDFEASIKSSIGSTLPGFPKPTLPLDPRFRFRAATARTKILSESSEVLEVYHEVVALKRCRVFHHSIGTLGDDETRELPPADELHYEVEKRLGSKNLQLQLRFGRQTRSTLEYFVEVVPELKPGQELGYWRKFRLPTHYPLTRASLRERTRLPGLRSTFGASVYCDNWDVVYDIDSITTAVHFPWATRIASRGVRVLHYVTREENPDETERCVPLLRFYDDRAASERILELSVPQPLINHSYYLLYEPLD